MGGSDTMARLQTYRRVVVSTVLALCLGLPGAFAQQPMTQQEIDARAHAQAQLNTGVSTAQASIGNAMTQINNNPNIPAPMKAQLMQTLGAQQATLANQASILPPQQVTVPVVETHMIYIPLQLPPMPQMNIPDATTILLPTRMMPL